MVHDNRSSVPGNNEGEFWFLRFLKRVPREESGMTSMASLLFILILILLIGYVANTGYEVKEKIELQNASDSAAYSASLWQARCMNGVTATNHMVGELTALCVLHEGLGGPELDLYPKGFPMTAEHTTLRPIIESLGEFAYAKVQTHGMYQFLEKIDEQLKKKLNDEMMEKNDSILMKGLDANKLYAGATIYDCKIALKKFYTKLLAVKAAGNALFMIPSSTVVAIGPVVIPVGLIAGVAAFAIHSYATYKLIGVGIEWLLLDALVRFAKITSPIKTKVVEKYLIPSLCEYNYSVMTGETDLKKVQDIARKAKNDPSKYKPIVRGAIAMTLDHIGEELKVDVAVFPKVENIVLPLRLEPAVKRSSQMNWGGAQPATPDQGTLDELDDKVKDAKKEFDKENAKMDRRRNELTRWILSDQEDVIDPLEKKLLDAANAKKKAEDKVKQSIADKENLDGKQEALESKLSGLETKLAGLEAQLPGLQSDVADLKADKAAEAAKNNPDNDKLQDIQDKIDDAEKKLQTTQDDIATTKADIETTKKDIAKAKTDFDNADQAIETAEQELKDVEKENEKDRQDLEDAKGEKSVPPTEARRPKGQRDKIELYLKTIQREVEQADKDRLTPDEQKDLDENQQVGGDTDSQFQKYRDPEEVQKELDAIKRDLDRINKTLKSKYIDEEAKPNRLNKNKPSLEALQAKLQALYQSKQKELEEAKKNPINDLLDQANAVQAKNPSYTNLTKPGYFNFDFETEKYSQWSRATYPYMDAGRAGIIYWLENLIDSGDMDFGGIPIPDIGAIGLTSCDFDKQYAKWTNRYLITKVYQFRDGRKWEKQGSQGGLTFKQSNQIKKHLLVVMDPGNPAPINRKHLKGFERWTGAASNVSDAAAKRSAEKTFTTIGIAYRKPHDTFLFRAFFDNPKQLLGTATCSQSIVYNSNEQTPNPSLGPTQAKVGWDTLNWDPDSTINEHPPNAKKGAKSWSDRSSSTNKKKLWPDLGSLSNPSGFLNNYADFLTEPSSKAKLNWQAKLMPVSPTRLGDSLGPQYEFAPLKIQEIFKPYATIQKKNQEPDKGKKGSHADLLKH